MKLKTSWHSERLRTDVTVTRWGDVGTPLLIFPTAAGDAEEIERFLIIQTLARPLEQGRIKIYSCDSVAGRVMLAHEGPPAHRMSMFNAFQQFIYHELVPAVRKDCESDDIELATAGASIGAFNALACVCRFPDVFSHAICMSGTYDLGRFLDGDMTEDMFVSSPVHYVPTLSGEHLERLRERFVLLPSGEGRAEDIGETWRVAHILGEQGIPNRVDAWGEDWDHDWPTWRNMLVRYVDELFPADA